MRYVDCIYGEVEITEPVVLDLIASYPMQRLKGVDQNGYLLNPKNIKFHFDKSRFTHSLGVYILLNKFKAPLREQLAGLLHDVSHSAFSHCIDILKGSGVNQDHQDNIHEQYILSTEIPKILEKYNLDLNYILDDNNFPLKEQPAPNLCADRIDYILRDAVNFEEITPEKAKYFLENLSVRNNRWIFNDLEAARLFKDILSKMNKIYYTGLPTAAMFFSVANFIRYSLDKKYISEDDLYTTDQEVIDKIEQYISKDEGLQILYNQVHNQNRFVNDYSTNQNKIVCKSRAIDPLFFDGVNSRHVSDVDLIWKAQMSEETKPKIYYLRFV